MDNIRVQVPAILVLTNIKFLFYIKIFFLGRLVESGLRRLSWKRVLLKKVVGSNPTMPVNVFYINNLKELIKW